jgi:hypothetical protein
MRARVQGGRRGKYLHNSLLEAQRVQVLIAHDLV